MRPHQYVILLLFFVMVALMMPSVLGAGVNNAAMFAVQREWDRAYLTASRGECVRSVNLSPIDPLVNWALEVLPESSRAMVNAGRVAYLMGDCKGARNDWLNALAHMPKDQITAFWLFMASGADVDTLPDALPAQQLSQTVWHFGRQAELANEEKSASSWYKLSFDLFPGRAAVDSLLRLENTVGLDLDKQAMWERVVATRLPGDADYWWASGKIAEIQEDWQGAADAFEQGARIAVSPYSYWLSQGAALEKLEKPQAAEAAYLSAVKSRPELFDAYYRLGLLYYDRKDYATAITWLQQALAILPDAFGVVSRLGLSYFELREFEEAERFLEQALVLRPDDMLTNYYLAQSLYERGQVALAISHLASAVRLAAGNRWEWAVQLGDWQVENNDHASALASYRRALELSHGSEQVQKRIDQLLAP